MADGLFTLTPEAKQFYDRNMLERALPNLALFQAGQARNIPKNGGNSVSYRRMNTISTATVALTEAVTPLAASLSITEITGTVLQYGNYVQLSDQIQMMGIDPVITEATDVLGENAGQSNEEIIRSELVNGTSVTFPPSRTVRNQVTSTDVLSLTQVRRAVRTLQANDVRPFYGSRNDKGMGGMFLGYIHPRQWFDLQGDTTVLNTLTYSDPEKLYTLELPMLAGVAWIISTKAPIFTAAGSGSIDVYGAFLFGKDAFGVVNVGGTGKFQTVAKPLGSAGAADPLEQRATVGWKAYALPKVLNNNFFTRLETAVSA